MVLPEPRRQLDVSQENLRVNSRVVALLTHCRMYVDHVPQRLHMIFGKPHDSVDNYHEVRRKEHKEHLGYRFCDALRNFTQHVDLPIHGLLIDSQWLDDQKKCEHHIAAHTNIKELEKSEISKAVLRELKANYEDRVDVTPLIRQYVTSLGRIHQVVRGRLDPEVDRWEQWIKDAVDKSEHGSHPALTKVDDNEELESVRVSKDWPERLRMLLHKNRNVTHYDKHYITGEAYVSKPREA
jgi:hypothetical protein